jgi:radical SAM superfamily enzyme YgiQ (UPF0313 family)
MARRKVVLYQPDCVFHTMPLALLAVGSHVDRSRFEVTVVDGRLERDPVAAVLARLDGALCLGVSVLTGAPIRDALRVSRAARARRPDLPIVWGGWHPSLFGAECLAEPAVDVTVQAQGEETFAEVLDRLDAGAPLDGCAGACFRGPDGAPRRNPPRPLRDVNALAPHDYGLIPVERYFQLKRRRQLDYVTSQGCRFRCAFCADPFVYGRDWTGLAPARVGEELAALHRRHGFDDVNFQDETFFTRADRVVAIAEELLRRELRVTWAATMRADQGVRLPEDAWALCRRSGLRRVLIGVESGNEEMLRRILKDLRLDQVFACAERCRAHGIAVNFPFIVGFPGESDASVRDTLAVVKRLRAMSPDFQTPIFYFRPYPGSPITEAAVRDGFRLPDTLEAWSDFDFVGAAGPWVDPAKFRRLERFKFYQQVAWDRGGPWRGPLRAAARLRLRRDWLAFPVEQVVGRWLRPAPRLS